MSMIRMSTLHNTDVGGTHEQQPYSTLAFLSCSHKS